MNPFIISNRAGLVVPPSNPTVEPELHALVDERLALHVARLPVVSGDLKTRLDTYPSCYESCIRSFEGMRLDAIYIAVTASAYEEGAQLDAARCDSLSQLFGIPVRTASRAILDALRTIGCDAIDLVSPYPEWLTQRSVRYWRSAGLDVRSVTQASSASAPSAHVYQLTKSDADRALEQAFVTKPSQVVLMTGTGMLTLPSLLEIGGQTNVLSSNLCGAWWLSRQIDLPANQRLIRASKELAQTLTKYPTA
jgi:maleate isomerase